MTTKKKQSKDDLLNETLADLSIALDVIEHTLSAGCNYCRKVTCPACAGGGWHSRTCKGAKLLRKYGRKVEIVGDK